MSASNAFETALLELIFNNDDIADIGDATGLQGSSSAGNLYVSLHTDSPGEAGDQETNECAYTSYARASVARSSAGWTVSGNGAANTAAINFPAATGGSESASHFGIGTDETGGGTLLFFGALGAPLAISSGVTPSFAIGELDVTVD